MEEFIAAVFHLVIFCVAGNGVEKKQSADIVFLFAAAVPAFLNTSAHQAIIVNTV